ncbi:MAG: pyruvate kinase [Pseudomonadales bacterium]|nr:pyruvate kinase [Pseudomonadales bacterium]
MRKTKIICTIGPATDSFNMLAKMYHSGMNVVRLNMSHGDHKSHAKVIKAIKTLNKNVQFPVPVLLDTQGPEIRTGQLENSLDLKTGDLISVSVSPDNVEERSIHIDYADLVESVNVGDRITVDNGLINLEVLDKSEKAMRCRVVDGGKLKSKSHVNLPGVRVNLPGITSKDRKDILFGVEQEVDFIAMSFVREANDIVELRKLLGNKAGKIKIIAKIEDQEALDNIEEIVDEADGVMVARGDLGVEIPFENLPNVQRQIVRLCHEKGKRVIVATHLLESMIDSPMPTRAEATDVANAVYEEVDAVMLSGETTVGKYPLKAIEALDRIAKVSEQARGLQFANVLVKDNDKQFLAASAIEMAESLNAAGIVVITRRGFMANYLANCLPAKVGIYAFTNDSRTRRQLSLSRGVIPYRTTFSQDPEKTLTTAFNVLRKKESFNSGDKVVVISDVIAGQGIDAIQIRSLP